MWRYLLRRLLQSIPLLLGISAISFFLVHLAPGGPIAAYENPRMGAADRQRLEHLLGLDRPLPVQYLYWLLALARGDLGRSYFSHEPVLSLILARLGATLELTLTALALALAIGLPLGLLAGLRRGSTFDRVARVITVATHAVPSWWLGLLGIILLAGRWHLLPSGGRSTVGAEFDLADWLYHLALPAFVLATGGWVAVSRFLRTQTLEVLGQEFVRTAAAKGLPPRAVTLRHVLPNALLPLATILGASLPGLFSGAALVEVVFGWPGMGQLTLDAALRRDYPVMFGALTLLSVLVVLGNLLADLSYALLDPRVRYS